ncbi:MAG: carbamoyltransferase [Methanobacteriota archaeon]|nr:MAG: carbamoyltransferase [Euryarchaeota archaeon]
MNILGINAFHADSSAALLVDGKLIAAAEEERFRRIKHWSGFPSEAIRYCLLEGGVSVEDLDAVAINQDSSANLLRKIGFTLKSQPELSFIIDRLRNKKQRARVGELLEKNFPGEKFRGKVVNIEHHLAHLSSAFHVSPYQEAVVLSVDGFGDFASSAWGLGSGTEINVSRKIYFPHSLGIFYQALTQYLGFPNYGDEYKVMGLAPYGKPSYMQQMHQIVQLQDDGTFKLNMRFFRHASERIEYEWENGVPVVGDLYSNELHQLLEGLARKKEEPIEQRHRDLARSIQAMYEEAFFHMLRHLYDRYGVNSLCLSGGCAMNSVANGKVRRMTPFKNVYVQAAAGDAGGAIGAAFSAFYQMAPRSNRSFVMSHAYWGPSFSDERNDALLRDNQKRLEEEGCIWEKVDDEEELCRKTAEAISEGKVVGWFQGRMEWGPRALGNRSIVCDPRRPDMKDILNLKIKRRESFRPFAPSILREKVSEWFEEDDEVPFMMKVFQIREEKRALIPAVAHVDGSGRLQTVYRETNPRYYRLIESFEKITGIPIVLNTSFNENEPVVCRPEEALDCFLRTKMDVLVLGNFMLCRIQ